jgi:hypothetical protein
VIPDTVPQLSETVNKSVIETALYSESPHVVQSAVDSMGAPFAIWS